MTEDEQKAFLKQVMEDENVECYWASGAPSGYEKVGINELQNIKFKQMHYGKFHMFFYLRNLEISRKIYDDERPTKGLEKDIDVKRSLVVDFDPSVVAKGREDILLQGAMGIPQRVWYEDEGIFEFDQIYKWFKSVKRWLIKNHLPYNKFKMHKGTEKYYDKGFYFSKGALEWVNSGGLLKDGIEGTLHFEPVNKNEYLNAKEIKED